MLGPGTPTPPNPPNAIGAKVCGMRGDMAGGMMPVGGPLWYINGV